MSVKQSRTQAHILVNINSRFLHYCISGKSTDNYLDWTFGQELGWLAVPSHVESVGLAHVQIDRQVASR